MIAYVEQPMALYFQNFFPLHRSQTCVLQDRTSDAASLCQHMGDVTDRLSTAVLTNAYSNVTLCTHDHTPLTHAS